MSKFELVEHKERTDCDVFIDHAEETIGSFGECIESMFDERKSKMNVVGNVFGFGKSLTKLAFNATGCAIKNAPKAVVAIASAKREFITAVEGEYRGYQKQQKEDALSEKIKQLQLKR